jgi:hypothetical protein
MINSYFLHIFGGLTRHEPWHNAIHAALAARLCRNPQPSVQIAMHLLSKDGSGYS